MVYIYYTHPGPPVYKIRIADSLPTSVSTWYGVQPSTLPAILGVQTIKKEVIRFKPVHACLGLLEA